MDQHDEKMKQDFALANLLTDEIDGAAALVIATPMYNWGPPSSLKAWIDRIINVRTWHQPTVDISNLPVTVIVTSAGLYSVGENVDAAQHLVAGIRRKTDVFRSHVNSPE